MQDYERSHLAALRPQLGECAVLLRKNDAFPLSAPCGLALYGSGARHTVFGGTGSGEVNARHFVTIEEGLRAAGFHITTNAWLDGYDAVLSRAKEAFLAELHRRARAHHTFAALEGMGAVMPQPEYDLPLDTGADAAVYVLSRISGEGNDRVLDGDVRLTRSEIRDILSLNDLYERFVLVLNVGGAVDLSPVREVGNILLLSQLGTETGCALADLLLGKTVPSGKLSATWSAWEDYPSVGDFGGMDDTRYREGVYVGYRYFDSVGQKALFPFGSGLGYTDFALTDAEISPEGEMVRASVTVKNTGSYPGKETVQIYVSVPWGKLDQPYQTLAAFQKTALLQPGASERVSLSFRLSELESYDASRACMVLEPGDYILRIGVSSAETCPVCILRLDHEVITARLKPIDGPDYEDWKPKALSGEDLSSLPVYPVEADSIPCLVPDYEKQTPIDPLARTLSDQELAMLSVGAFNPRGGIGSVIGNASTAVPGAAGESCHVLVKRGVPFLVMADGPAGLRLMRDYIKDEKGVIPLGETLPATITELLPPIVRKGMAAIRRKPSRGAQTMHQYCTAIPIGTALAQSWNPDLAALCGEIVADEMERFGVHLWLAPALNLHRDLRCGRNFEYYSEDPLLSGRMAAAITRAVQTRSGRGVTIKHYCVNNQETNRYQSNSVVSHRALRELYLRGFGICVREADPCAVMSSYNLLNGVHTSQRRDITEDILRAEFGFRGLVMTDWVMASMKNKLSRYPVADASKIPASGNDVMMPGSPKDYRRIRKALRTGALDREQVRRNVSRLIALVRRLTGDTSA